MAVVDDDSSLCKALARLLSAWNIRATTYGSAEAFLQDLNRPVFDCLILDIQLGGMSGFDLEKQLRKTCCDIPVVFITAQDVAETRARALAIGAAFVRKAEPGEVLHAAILQAVSPE